MRFNIRKLSPASRLVLFLSALCLIAVLPGCGTGGGVRIGGGTATGAVAGGIYSLATQDGGRGALIGTGVGIFADLLTGQPPLEVEPPYAERRPVYRGHQPDYREYQREYRGCQLDDRNYGPEYRGYQREYQEPRQYYDRRCGCYRTD